MDLELRLLRAISTNLPPIRGIGYFINKIFVPFYRRKNRDEVKIIFFNRYLMLDPHENMEKYMIFYPQIVDRNEFKFMGKILNDKSVFIDLGSNVGMYSMVASNYISKGKILAIEADPFTYNKLCRNIALNDLKQVIPINMGVSDKVETMKLYLNEKGNRGGNSFLQLEKERNFISVDCNTLNYIVEKENLQNIDLLKIDIEAYEYIVLNQFFKEAAVHLHPKYIITEFHESLIEVATGSILDLLKCNNYAIQRRYGLNYIFKKENLI